ncbi:MAG TPA: VOC family protein [Steroidobacteraceae bacterium]|nr:VOC family protein [Steroidobacteraceae bacterium]
MHRSRLAALVLDSHVEDIDSSAEFWGRALGCPVRPADPGDAKYRELDVPDTEVRALLQQVDHPSRVHLDIETDDIAAEVARLEKLGAKVIDRLPRWTVMEAPTGHRFCVVQPQRPDFESSPDVNVWD